MRNLALTIVVLSLAGCSSDTDEPCDQAHRSGTYVQHMTERANGSCGPVSDQVIRLGVPVAGAECADDAPDVVSSDQCKLTRQYTCVFDAGSGTYTAVTTEQDGGAKLTGVLTMRLTDKNGEFLCASTYDVTFTRQ